MAATGTELPWDYENSKVPPGTDGVCCSMEDYLERLNNWIKYTELLDHPERVGPAIFARLKGKPRLVAKQMEDTLARKPGKGSGRGDPAVKLAPWLQAQRGQD